MATTDSLLCLRQAIASNNEPIPTTSAEAATSADSTEPNLALATHLQFNHIPDQHFVFPLDEPTRFFSSDDADRFDEPANAVDLRTIYWAWLKRDVAIAEYISSTRALNEELPDGRKAVQNLVFAEKLDLITWLEGASDESEHIKVLENEAEANAAAAAGAASVAAGAAGGIATVASGLAGAGRSGRTIDPRLREILNGERRMGDRNSVLRGIKPTDFSHIRKHSEAFLGRNRKQTGRLPPATAPNASIPQNPPLVSNRTKPGRRPEPIILLSPSASSLLRMSNIKSFLDSGTYTPPDSSSSNLNILHVSRLLPSVDPQRPLRFILVDTPDQFKPDYWSRVVAVFTTGQTWQFKSYKWQNPPELFGHALGVYIGWRGEDVPSTVRGWGRSVISTQIEKFNINQGAQGRWRDREVVEGIWTAIEESMRSKGWGKDIATR